MERQPPHSRALRRYRFSEPGEYYVITTCADRSQPIFENLAAARIVIACLRFQSRRRVCTVSYVLMPDHLHWLFMLDRDVSLAMVLWDLKRFSARQINRMQGARGRTVWQKGFYDHRIRTDEELFMQSRYLVENPVRAGLVEREEDYPHWDGAWLYDRDFIPV